MSWSSRLQLIDNLSCDESSTQQTSSINGDLLLPPSQPSEQKYTPMVGFITFLVTTKILTFLVYGVLLIISNTLLHVAFFWTVFAFSIAELILIGVTVYHVIHPTLSVVFCLIGSEMLLGMTKIVFGIVLEYFDGGKNCVELQNCLILNISERERFTLFWFCSITALYDYFLALIFITHSPQMHYFEIGDHFLF